MAGLTIEPPDLVCARLVAAQLAADTDLAAFFGSNISAADHDELSLPLPVPVLLVLPVKQDPTRRSTGIYDSLITLEVRAVLPRPTPATSFLSAPTAPAVAAPGYSITYRITQSGPAGESWASSPVTSSGITTLTLPALSSGATRFRIWRSRAGATACRWVGESYASGAWADSAANAEGDELAPVRGLGSRLLGMVQTRLSYATDDNDYLPEGGRYMAAGGVRLKPLPSRFYAERNLVAHVLEATYQTTYDPKTQVIG